MPLLTSEQFERTAAWIARHQRRDGAIPWFRRQKMDSWDHLECAMALAAAGMADRARAALRFLAKTQEPEGTWPAAYNSTQVLDPTRDANHAAYIATALWYYYTATGDRDTLKSMWNVLRRAIHFVLSLQHPSGAVFWATDADGTPWPAPQLTSSSSIHGSLVCAERIALLLGRPQPRWTRARRRLADALRRRDRIFEEAPLPTPLGNSAMDWFYPVLAGALRGAAARAHLRAGASTWLVPGHGCRCVRGREWYTVAETCEAAITFAVAGLRSEALALFDTTARLRCEDGGYWTGDGYENGQRVLWPKERPTWTAASVLLAHDTLAGESATSGFFASLDGADLDRAYAAGVAGEPGMCAESA